MSNNQQRNTALTRRPVKRKSKKMSKLALRKLKLKSMMAALSLVASIGAVHAGPKLYDSIVESRENQINVEAINEDILKQAYDEIYNDKTEDIRTFLVEDTAEKINNSQYPELLFNIYMTDHIDSEKGTISNLYNELDVLKEKGFLFFKTDFDEYLTKNGKAIISEAGDIRRQRVESTIEIADKTKEDIATNQYDEELEQIMNEINSYGRSK